MAEAETLFIPEHAVKLKSIERTLLPLVKQASVMINIEHTNFYLTNLIYSFFHFNGRRM